MMVRIAYNIIFRICRHVFYVIFLIIIDFLNIFLEFIYYCLFYMYI